VKHDGKTIVILDCQVAGISGDMLLSALIDLGANFQKIKEGLERAAKLIPNLKNFKISRKKILKKGINATQVQFTMDEAKDHQHGKYLRMLIRKITKNFDWNDSEKTLAENILHTLLQAESKIHGTSPDEVHLHEAGSFDTIADIIGFIFACKDLKLLENCKWYSTPIAVGGGLLKFSHGLASNPAPATLEILKTKNLEIVGGPVDSELITPTGASILVNLIEKTRKFYPPIKIQAIGYGAGNKDFPEVPNVLRIVLGKAPVISPYNFEQIVTIETNVDDITGELLGNTTKKIITLGYAKDIAIIPISSKKRQGYLIQILTSFEYLTTVTQILINELGTLGVRFFPTARYTLTRKIVSIPIRISNQTFNVAVKISWDLNNVIIQTKPESDEVLEISEKTGISMREILQKIDIELSQKYPIGKKLRSI